MIIERSKTETEAWLQLEQLKRILSGQGADQDDLDLIESARKGIQAHYGTMRETLEKEKDTSDDLIRIAMKRAQAERQRLDEMDRRGRC